MRAVDPREPENIEAVEAIIARIRHEWEDEANVVAIAPGIKLTGGVPKVDTLSIQFFVHRKVDADEAEAWGWRVIPSEIDDIPTDVETTQQPPTQILEQRRNRFDPLVGGIVIGNASLSSVGTLGGIVFTDDAAGTRVGLTNEHVLVHTNEGATGDPVAQPWRDYDADVSIVEADCCPDGKLSFGNVPNPLRDAMTATAVAAAVAAAASDQVDPHRRGQQNTPVPADERTTTEHVHMHISYPEMPLPGTPYTTKVSWDYTRFTDRGEHHYSAADELMSNPHVLREQELLTHKTTYDQGALVYYLAAIGKQGRRLDCAEEYVVAHAVSPSEDHLQSTVLRPVQPGDLDLLQKVFHDIDPTQPLLPQYLYFGDYDWAAVPPAGILRFEHRGFDVAGIGGARIRFTDDLPRPIPDGMGEVIVPGGGIGIGLPAAAELAVAGVFADQSPMVMTAYDGDQAVGSQSGSGGGTPANLMVTADRITRVTITGGGGAGKLLVFGSARTLSGPVCTYWGTTRLAPSAELGLWSTYLMVQTTNDVPAGTDPAKAAQTIGGLVSSHNLVSAGRRLQLPYGEFCAIDAIGNGAFKVVSPAP
jgi:hypothetical protein